MNPKLSFFDRQSVQLGLLFLVVFVCYIPALNYSFSPLDEQWLLINNMKALNAPGAFRKIFSDHIQHVYYRPLLLGSLLLDYRIGGLDPRFFHLVNIVLHLLCIGSLYYLLAALGAGNRNRFLCCLLFAVHPLQLHAVAWIPGRNDLLLALFGLLSVYALVRILRQFSVLWLLFHLAMFFLALLSKESAVILPLIYLLLMLVYTKDLRRYLIGAGWLVLLSAWWLLRSGVVSASLAKVPLGLSSVLLFGRGLIVFSGKTLFPVFQSVSPTASNDRAGFYLVVLLLFVFALSRLFFISDRRLFFFGIVSFFLMLSLPVWFGSVSILGEQYEHRAYSALGFACISLSQLRPYSLRAARFLFTAFFIFYTGKVFYRLPVYRDELSYLTEATRDCEKNYLLQAQMANFLFTGGKFNEALPFANRAIILNPGKAQLYHSRASVLEAMGRPEESIADHSTALRLSKGDRRVLLSRCLAYRKIHRPDLALQDLEDLKRKDPGFTDLGLEMKLRQEFLELRVKSLSEMIEKEPGRALLYVNRAEAFVSQRRGPEALQDLVTALKLEPQNPAYIQYYEKLRNSLANQRPQSEKNGGHLVPLPPYRNNHVR